MKIHLAIMVGALALWGGAASAHDRDPCRAVAVRQVIANDDADFYSLKKGEIIGAVTTYRTFKSSGEHLLCSHGGGCYPRDALRLMGCKIVPERDRFADLDPDVHDSWVVPIKAPSAP